MSRVFDNAVASSRARKSGLKTFRSKLGLLNSALYALYGLKLKAIDKKRIYYHLEGPFDGLHAPKPYPYQMGEELWYENGEDTRFGYSALSPYELEVG